MIRRTASLIVTDKRTLLEQAKATQISRKADDHYSEEQLELIKAWLDDEIRLAQVMKVTKKTSSVYLFLAMGARILWRRQTNVKTNQD